MSNRELTPPLDQREMFALMCKGFVVDTDQIHGYGFHTLEEDQGEFPEDLLSTDDYCRFGDGIKYLFLTGIARKQVSDSLTEEHAGVKWMGFESGLLVIGRFLDRGVEAYARHCAAQAVEPSVPGLAAIFHRSLPALARFARMSHTMNRPMEAIYGLRESGWRPDLYGDGRDFAVAGEPNALRLEPVDWEESLLRATGRIGLAPEDPAQVDLARQDVFDGSRCAAYEQLLPASYHWAVDFAAATHEFFASDIKAIMDTQTNEQ
jgi:hypothetical protein